MKYYIDGVLYEVSDLTTADRERLAEEQHNKEHLYWSSIPYDVAVDKEIRKLYAQHQVEAILNNYLAYPDNEKYRDEFMQLQEYRNRSKTYVKEKKALYGNPVVDA